jgi:hypothetical protein
MTLRDLSPLRGAPIETLNIYTIAIKDFTVLFALPKLQKLRTSKTGPILEPLRDHSTLKWISVDAEGSYRPVAEFWAEYDAQQATGKK